jgi:hypothetical protein
MNRDNLKILTNMSQKTIMIGENFQILISFSQLRII